MEIVYLSNGQECYLIETVGSKYLVRRIFQAYHEEEGWYDVEDPNDTVVDTIFKTKPVEKIAAEVMELNEQKESLTKEVNAIIAQNQAARRESENISKTQINNQKFIINKNELLKANSIVMFPKDSVMPIMKEKKDSYRGLKISFVFSLLEYEVERSWGYKIYEEYESGSSFLCQKDGVLIDPTEEDVANRIRARLAEHKWDAHHLLQVPDEYLSETQIAEKLAYQVEAKRKQRENLERELQIVQNRLKECE